MLDDNYGISVEFDPKRWAWLVTGAKDSRFQDFFLHFTSDIDFPECLKMPAQFLEADVRMKDGSGPFRVRVRLSPVGQITDDMLVSGIVYSLVDQFGPNVLDGGRRD